MTKKSERKNNSKLIIFSILTLVFLITLGVVGFSLLKNSEKQTTSSDEQISLNSEYLNTDGKQIEISKQTENTEDFLQNLITEEKSFVVYASLPICSGETAEFKEYVLRFQKENKISFYYITSDYVKDTSIYETVKYFPSVIIYDKGKIVKYLRFDSDEDKDFYRSYDGFSKWFKANVKL